VSNVQFKTSAGGSAGSASLGTAFLASGRTAGSRRLVTRRALGPIIRRDPQINKSLQQWVRQQLRVLNREAGKREKDTTDKENARKAAYLARLGLGEKANKALAKKKPWHLSHLVEGDVLGGSFEHPAIAGGAKVDLRLTVTSSAGGTWVSTKRGFESEFELQQDFPIVWEKGEARDESMVTYIFNKYNAGWRNLQEPMPDATSLEHLSLQGLRMFFGDVAQVEGFPDEAEWKGAVADPDKGMTKAEFVKYIKDEDDNYLESAFPNVYTGRRVRFSGEELMLDGDFQASANGKVLGYTFFKGEAGGTFALSLAGLAS